MDDVASTFISKVHGTNSATFATGCFLMRHLSFKKKEVDFSHPHASWQKYHLASAQT